MSNQDWEKRNAILEDILDEDSTEYEDSVGGSGCAPIILLVSMAFLIGVIFFGLSSAESNPTPSPTAPTPTQTSVTNTPIPPTDTTSTNTLSPTAPTCIASLQQPRFPIPLNEPAHPRHAALSFNDIKGAYTSPILLLNGLFGYERQTEAIINALNTLEQQTPNYPADSGAISADLSLYRLQPAIPHYMFVGQLTSASNSSEMQVTVYNQNQQRIYVLFAQDALTPVLQNQLANIANGSDPWVWFVARVEQLETAMSQCTINQQCAGQERLLSGIEPIRLTSSDQLIAMVHLTPQLSEASTLVATNDQTPRWIYAPLGDPFLKEMVPSERPIGCNDARHALMYATLSIGRDHTWRLDFPQADFGQLFLVNGTNNGRYHRYELDR